MRTLLAVAVTLRAPVLVALMLGDLQLLLGLGERIERARVEPEGTSDFYVSLSLGEPVE